MSGYHKPSTWTPSSKYHVKKAGYHWMAFKPNLGGSARFYSWTEAMRQVAAWVAEDTTSPTIPVTFANGASVADVVMDPLNFVTGIRGGVGLRSPMLDLLKNNQYTPIVTTPDPVLEETLQAYREEQAQARMVLVRRKHLRALWRKEQVLMGTNRGATYLSYFEDLQGAATPLDGEYESLCPVHREIVDALLPGWTGRWHELLETAEELAP